MATTEPTPNNGTIRDPVTGGLLTVASSATDTRVKPVAPGFTLPPWLAGVLGLLAVVAGVPAAAILLLPAGMTAPVWLVTAATIGGAVTPFLSAGAYWAAGGSLTDAVKRFAPRVPAPAAPSDGSSTPRVGPPEP